MKKACPNASRRGSPSLRKKGVRTVKRIPWALRDTTTTARISDPTSPSWGRMIQQALAFTYLDVWQWWLLPPGIAVSSLVLAFALIGSGLEETDVTD